MSLSFGLNSLGLFGKSILLIIVLGKENLLIIGVHPELDHVHPDFHNLSFEELVDLIRTNTILQRLNNIEQNSCKIKATLEYEEEVDVFDLLPLHEY